MSGRLRPEGAKGNLLARLRIRDGFRSIAIFKNGVEKTFEKLYKPKLSVWIWTLIFPSGSDRERKSSLVMRSLCFPCRVRLWRSKKEKYKKNTKYIYCMKYFIYTLGDPEVTANLYSNFAYPYWEGCVICTIYLR